ncbi:MAG: CHAT domain-containing protein [Chloroflexi bacterium]|nr:CHAT domain-containing protein [Chloroflexota bacterium]
MTPLAYLDSSPRQARTLARSAHEQACAAQDRPAQAETALALAIISNRLGHYREALSHAELALSHYDPDDKIELWATSICEATWAKIYLAQLDDIPQLIERVRAQNPSPALCARCDWIQARVLRDHGEYPQTIALLQQAVATYGSLGATLDSARVEYDIIHTKLLTEQIDQDSLDRVRNIFMSANAPLDIAQCKFLWGLTLEKLGRFANSNQVLLQARKCFIDLDALAFAANCDIELGINYRRLSQFEDSVSALSRGRDSFLAHGVSGEVVACSINLANTLYDLNRYDEALPLYEECLEFAQAQNRRARVGIISENLALVHDKQGRYSRAIDLHLRAQEIFRERNRDTLVVQSQMNLAATYLQLGQTMQALECLRQARAVFSEKNLTLFLAQADVELIQVLIARSEWQSVDVYLQEAHEISVNENFDSLTAVCDRLASQVAAHANERERALALIASSRVTFLRQAQIVDAALCDLTQGEFHLQWQEWKLARKYFAPAQKILKASFPDQAWRAAYGLSRCASTQGKETIALEHALDAMRTIAQVRTALIAEQFSNDFFADRQSVYTDALRLAQRLQQDDAALQVIEASKARTFLNRLENRGWVMPPDHTDPYVADLIAREKTLRYQIGALRRKMVVQATHETGEPLRGEAELTSVSAAALQELDAVSKAYESVVTQLRLSASGLAGVSIPGAFSLDAFRQSANAHLQSDWCALDYYFTGDTLTIATVTPDRLKIETKTLSAYDQTVLAKCVSSESDLRELIYRGTLHGQPAPSSANHLQHLYRLLVPRDITASSLILAPHGSLHALPFQALQDGATYLAERYTIVYAPSLQAMHLLLKANANDCITNPLALGLDQFSDSSLRALPSAENELAAIRQAFDGRGEYRWREAATRKKLFELNASGALRQFDALHFATHAILDQAAPHQSRIVLSDEALTVADLFELRLNARVVTLSACQTALGTGGTGDELIGLARAFFYAGAQALIATLWSVEDNATSEMIGRFYRHGAAGKKLAEALRLAQCEMIRAGRPPFEWAAFVLIGRP